MIESFTSLKQQVFHNESAAFCYWSWQLQWGALLSRKLSAIAFAIIDTTFDKCYHNKWNGLLTCFVTLLFASVRTRLEAYMANRDFSDSVKLNAITENLRNNNGEIRCAVCGIKLSSINECHFDHIFPFAKGGKSTTDNCQILCISCNLKKNDKELFCFFFQQKILQFFIILL